MNNWMARAGVAAALIFCVQLLTPQLAHAVQLPFTQAGNQPLVSGNVLGGASAQGAGVAVSADGIWMAVAGNTDNGNFGTGPYKGAVWIYRRTGTTWAEHYKIVPVDADADANIRSVALSADGLWLAIGGPGGAGATGQAWMFQRNGATWNRQVTITDATSGLGSTRFGYSVALSADASKIVVGAPGDSGSFGLAILYKFDTTSFDLTEPKTLNAFGIIGDPREGFSVAISGDGTTIMIGGPDAGNNGSGVNESGAAWVTKNEGVDWTQIVANSPSEFAHFGSAVALSDDGNMAVVGAPGEDSGAGAAYVIETVGGSIRSRLFGSSASGAAGQGSSVAIDAKATTIVIGGPGDGGNDGAAWVFSGFFTSWPQVGPKLVGTSGDNTTGMAQGTSVAIGSFGDVVALGAPLNASGIGGAWVFHQTPIITSITPALGDKAGTTPVKIAGTGLSNVFVTFDSVPTASPIEPGLSFEVSTTAPAHPVDVVSVIATNGLGLASAATNFTYGAPVPVISSFSPDSGSTSGSAPGNTMSIFGHYFSNVDANDLSSVKFGGTNAVEIIVRQDDLISVVVPPHEAGPVDVVVKNANGSSAPATYTYMAPPQITSVAPSGGPLAGGTTVIITGTGFQHGFTSDVQFGADSATEFSIDSNTQITAKTPAHAIAEAVDVRVVNFLGDGFKANGFTYSDPPAVTQVLPSAGTSAGSTTVTITGIRFTGVTGVTFGGVAATHLIFVSDTQIKVKTPMHAQGGAAVRVTTNLGATDNSSDGLYTFVDPATITSVTPAGGPIGGGTHVTIKGTNLSNGTFQVMIGGSSVLHTVVNSTTINATTPQHASGAVDIAVSTAAGTRTKADAFTYFAKPTISAVNPNQGPAKGGTSVAIVGTNLSGVTGVKFGTTAATSFSASSSTRATATAPAHAVGAVNVALTTPGGTSVVGGVNKFTYTPTPVLTTIAKFAGGTSDGSKPVGGLVADANGVLYGTTSQGGKNNLGTIFRLVPSGGSYIKAILYHFDALTGATPFAGLVIDSSKNLYGVTTAGGNKNKGVVFEYTNSTKKLSVLYNFQGTTADGGVPYATLARDSAGLLYGATTEGGSKGKGTTFTFKEPSTFKVTHHFTGGADGDNPQGAMLLDANKNVYGTTIEGGAPNQGVAYKIAPNGTRTILRTFSASSADSHAPRGGLFMVGSMLFGTASTGGTSNKGTVFEIMPPSTSAPILFNFTGTSTGANPYAGVVSDSATNLYGTTFAGGTKNRGTVFNLLPPANGRSTWSQSVMWSFQGGTGEGASPAAPVLLGKNRTLFGTTNGGGSTACAGGCGTVFKVTY